MIDSGCIKLYINKSLSIIFGRGWVYFLLTLIAVFFYSFVLVGIDTFRVVLISLLLTGLADFIMHPKKAFNQVRNRSLVLLVSLIILFVSYEVILSVYVRDSYSDSKLYAHLFFLVGVLPLIVTVRVGWHSQLMIYSVALGVFIGASESVGSFLSGSVRVNSASFNTIYWGFISALQFGFLFIYLFFYNKKSNILVRLLLWVALVLAFVNLLASGSRGPLMALLITLPLVIILIARHKLRTLIIVSVGGGTFILGIALFVYSVPNHFLSQRINTAIEEFQSHYSEGVANTSVSLRLQMWDVSAAIASERFFFGLSDDDIAAYKNEAVELGMAVPNLVTYKHMHNDLIETLVRKGFIGVILYLVLLCALFVNGYLFKQNFLGVCLMYFVLLYFFSGFTNAYTASWRGLALILLSAIFFYQTSGSLRSHSEDSEHRERRSL